MTYKNRYTYVVFTAYTREVAFCKKNRHIIESKKSNQKELHTTE